MREAMTSQDRREKSGLFGFSFKVLEIEQRLLFLFRIFAVNN